MSSSSKTRKFSLKKTKTLSKMEQKHELSDIVIDFDEDLITCTRTLKSHRWSNKKNFVNDISTLQPSEILDLPLSNFGLCDISSINKFMVSIHANQKAAVNELFKIKYAIKQYPGEVNEDIMRAISKTKFTKLKEKAQKDKKWEDSWGERYRSAELGISTDPSSAAASATVATTPPDELRLEERLAALGGSRSVKRRKTHRRKSIKRRGTKRRGTKRRGTKRK